LPLIKQDFCLDLSRNGNLIAAPTSKNSIKIFDSNSLHLTTTLNARSLAINAPGSKRDPGSIKAVEWLDEQTIIAGLDSSDGAIAAFDIRTGQIGKHVLSYT
jgi:WD40 repeat protein